uniref:Protein F n=1 Tax=Hepacivirus hominis TaxID=3052230 RepID=A0A6M3B0K6_9HEPC|nr:protein F [Hepacivirus hominis]
MSTLPKPQRKPKETPTVVQWMLSSRAAVRSLVESTYCRAGAHDWVCARRGRLLNDPSPEAGVSPYQRHASQRAGTGLSLVTPGPFMGMRAADGRDGSCLPAVLALIGAPMTPGDGRATWVKSSIP